MPKLKQSEYLAAGLTNVCCVAKVIEIDNEGAENETWRVEWTGLEGETKGQIVRERLDWSKHYTKIKNRCDSVGLPDPEAEEITKGDFNGLCALLDIGEHAFTRPGVDAEGNPFPERMYSNVITTRAPSQDQRDMYQIPF